MNKRTVPLILIGFGNVGRAFHRLVEEKEDLLSRQYDLQLSLQAILNSKGGVLSSRSISPLTGPIAGGKMALEEHPAWHSGLSLKTILQSTDRGALVECTPSNLKTGEPALSYIRLGLDAGWNIVTANKGPLVVDLKGLRKKATEKGLALKFSAAAGAALPGLDVGLFSLAGAEILGFEGILNGTTNFLLTRMNQGDRYEDALQEAREKGIAEPDPSQDVEGWDTAAKVLILANAVLGLDLTIADIDRHGMTGIPAKFLAAARAKGKSVKLLGRVYRSGSQYKAEVKPIALDSGHPLFGVNGTNKGIVYFTDTMGEVVVMGGKSDPRGAAAALLKDLINIYLRK